MTGFRNKGFRPTRRAALTLIGAGALAASGISFARAATDDDEVLTEARVLRDPDVPVAGNPDGNISIIEWSDYNCPYCRKLEPELRQVIQDDGKVRLVMKDWPIQLLAAAGVDMDRLKGDLTAHAKGIDAVLKRNNDQAEAFGFRGTPSFIVGKYRVPGVLSMAEFEQVIADARKAKMN